MTNEITETAVQTATVVPAAVVVLAVVAGLLAICTVVLAFLLYKKTKSGSGMPCTNKLTPEITSTQALEQPICSPGIGKVHCQGAREYQEDCFAVSEPDAALSRGLLAVVSDGMGGLEDGEQVSQTAVGTAISEFYELGGDADLVLMTLLNKANDAVNKFLGPERLYKCGATMVMGLIKNGYFHYISVGDSRICLFRDGILIQLNREHVFKNELLHRAVNGEASFQEAYEHPKRAGLSSFLGQGNLKYVDIGAKPVSVCPGDKFILMSDGVYNALSAEELSSALVLGPEDAAEEIQRLIEAKAFTNQDNYTAVIIGC